MIQIFTGIIEEVGTLEAIQTNTQSLQLIIAASLIIEDMQLGDSISVNGVCLTVTTFAARHFTVDVMPETFHATSLRMLKVGRSINLERALTLKTRLGGHFVTGHVDGVAIIQTKEQLENALYITLKLPDEFQHFLLSKGSIALDGISLTIFSVKNQQFTVSLIPHTQSTTILADKVSGDIVNFECDVLGKYVERMLQRTIPEKRTITKDFLQNNGFC